MNPCIREILLSVAATALLATAASAAGTGEARSWTERVRLSGSADIGFFGGGAESVAPSDGFDIWDARFFVDAELGESLKLGNGPVIRNAGFTFEWNLVRNGRLANTVGLIYLDLEGIGESTWWNARIGRFHTPFGETYKLYSKGYADRSFVQQPLGGPWWWDEGLLIHGSSNDSRFGYFAALMNGDNDFNDQGGGVQLSGKLWMQPCEFLYASASGLWTNELGRVDAGLWLGESWGRPLGSGGPPLPNIIGGIAVGDDPEGLGQTWAVGLDVIAMPVDGVRLWISGGRYDLSSRGASLYDRTLWYWTAELVVEGSSLSPALHSVFFGLRSDALGTFDDDRGYLLDVRHTGTYGYNMQSTVGYSAVAGWRLGKYITLRAEYSHRDVKLVDGTVGILSAQPGHDDVYSVEFGLHF